MVAERLDCIAEQSVMLVIRVLLCLALYCLHHMLQGLSDFERKFLLFMAFTTLFVFVKLNDVMGISNDCIRVTPSISTLRVSTTFTLTSCM